MTKARGPPQWSCWRSELGEFGRTALRIDVACALILQSRDDVVTPRLTLVLFLLFQLCDGIFTFFVVRAYGFTAEANALLASWMALVGIGPALVGAKVLAGACGTLLYQLHVHRALFAVTALYAVAAIGPWIVVLKQL